MLCSLPQPLVAVPSFMFVNAFKAMLPLALGFAAGCMVWMVFAELIPDALEAAAHGKVRAAVHLLNTCWDTSANAPASAPTDTLLAALLAAVLIEPRCSRA